MSWLSTIFTAIVTAAIGRVLRNLKRELPDPSRSRTPAKPRLLQETQVIFRISRANLLSTNAARANHAMNISGTAAMAVDT